MSSIPLVALGYRSPEPVDALGDYSKALGIRGAIQNQQFQQQLQPIQLQQQQQQLALEQQKVKDEQAGQAAYGEWDGKDYDQLGALIIKHGGSLSSAQQVRTFGLNSQKTLSEILKNNGEAGKAKVDTLAKNNEIAAGKIGALNDLPDEQLPQGILQTAQEGATAGWFDQQHLQMAQQLAQQSPDQIRKALPYIAKSYLSESEQAKQALNAADLATKSAALPGVQADAAEKQAKQAALAAYIGSHPGKTQADFAVSQAARTAGAEAQAKLGSEESLAKYNFNLNQGLLPPELKGVAPHLVAPAASQYEKSSTEYAGAKAAQDEMSTIIADARAGNKVAYSYAPTTGVLTINSANGVKRVNMAEIRSYAGAGSVIDRIAGYFGKQISGASIPDDILNDMQQVHDDLGKNSQRKYANEVQATNATYGSKFSPQDFSKNSPSQEQPVFVNGKLVGYTSDGKTMRPAQ